MSHNAGRLDIEGVAEYPRLCPNAEVTQTESIQEGFDAICPWFTGYIVKRPAAGGGDRFAIAIEADE